MRRAGSWLRLIAPLLLLGLVLWTVDPGEAWERLGTADPALLLAALVASQIVIVASALRWADTARRLGHPIPIGEAVAEYYVSSFLNQVLPGGVSGDAIRVWRGRDRGGAGPVARGVVIERLSGQVALAAALAFGTSLGGVPGTGMSVVLFVAALTGLLAILSVLRGFGRDLRRAWLGGGAAATQGLLNLAVTAALIGGFVLAARAVGTIMDPATALTLVPVCLLAMILPVGIGGLGLREGAAAALWPLAGLAPEAGVAAALLFGLAALLGALPGAAILLRHRRRPRR